MAQLWGVARGALKFPRICTGGRGFKAMDVPTKAVQDHCWGCGAHYGGEGEKKSSKLARITASGNLKKQGHNYREST